MRNQRCSNPGIWQPLTNPQGTAAYSGPRELLLHCFILWFHFQSKLQVPDGAFVATEHLLQGQHRAPSVISAPKPTVPHVSPSLFWGLSKLRLSFEEGGRRGRKGTHRLLGQIPQHLGEVGVHLLRCPLQEPPAAPHKQRVTCRDRVRHCPQSQGGTKGSPRRIGGCPSRVT